MRDITHCPNCQTQFFVSEDQLSQHNGLVRCGQCLHVFNAKEQFVAQSAIDQAALEKNTLDEGATTVAEAQISEQPNAVWPTLEHSFATKATPSIGGEAPKQIEAELPLTEVQDPHQETITLSTAQTETSNLNVLGNADVTQTDSHQLRDDANTSTTRQNSESQSELQPVDDINNLSFIHGNQSNYFNDLAKHAKLDGKKTTNHLSRWLWVLGTFILLIITAAQSVYFLRNTIAIYYPHLKPHLLLACQHLHCSIELPKKIEFIIIDDSDMQEDLAHTGVMHLSSSLFNKADFVQTYPNVELTLTDTNDNAVLRRVFKPAEYLPPKTDIAAGFSAGREVKLKLAITTQDANVAGYRLFVTY